jgi:hypothetical protein
MAAQAVSSQQEKKIKSEVLMGTNLIEIFLP